MIFPQRKLHRLKSWDYSQTGYYFITVCTYQKQPLLSRLQISNGDAAVRPTAIGQIVLDCWEKMNTVSPYVKTDAFCLMPNHLHGIIIIDKPEDVAVPSLSQLVRGFKSTATRLYNSQSPPEKKNKLWQSSFYDEIIRNEEMLHDIRKYILGNPSKWLDDPMYIEPSRNAEDSVPYV